MSDVSKYISLITSEHRDKPLFKAVIEALVTPFVDEQNVTLTIPALYDIDTAIAGGLDAIGEWVGVSRDVGDIGTLTDDSFRILLKARIARNHWDGTIPGAYAIWDTLFQGTVQIYIFDNQDMSMVIGYGPGPFDAQTTALIQGGYLEMRPMGVLIQDYVIVGNQAFFGFDTDSPLIKGFDLGVWQTSA